MNIRFISTLTAEDESQYAKALLRAVSALLETIPIAYTLRVETLSGEVFQHTQPPSASDQAAPESMRVTGPMRRFAGAIPSQHV